VRLAGSALLIAIERRSHRMEFEGFYVRAEDEHGVPFIVDNFWRVSDGGGGQWARSDFPFPHG